jgi:excisionase family DNA binding protein
MGRNTIEYRGCNSDPPGPQHGLPSDQIRPLLLKGAEDRAVNHGATAAALLRPPTVRKLVVLLQPLSVRARTTILAQVIHEGTMTRVWADQVLFALAWTATADTRSIAPCLKDKRSATDDTRATCRSCVDDMERNTMAYTLTEAATATGLSRSTIFRAIKSGRISATRIEGNFSIEPVELHRVFPAVSEKRADEAAMNQNAIAAALPDMALIAQLESEIRSLRGMSALTEERFREMRDDREESRDSDLVRRQRDAGAVNMPKDAVDKRIWGGIPLVVARSTHRANSP